MTKRITYSLLNHLLTKDYASLMCVLLREKKNRIVLPSSVALSQSSANSSIVAKYFIEKNNSIFIYRTYCISFFLRD